VATSWLGRSVSVAGSAQPCHRRSALRTGDRFEPCCGDALDLGPVRSFAVTGIARDHSVLVERMQDALGPFVAHRRRAKLSEIAGGIWITLGDRGAASPARGGCLLAAAWKESLQFAKGNRLSQRSCAVPSPMRPSKLVSGSPVRRRALLSNP
jgi:hypothetical protein